MLVHDAARPFIRRSVIKKLVDTAEKSGAAIAAVQAKDTMKLAPSGIVEETVDREMLWIVQTPQAFRYDVLKSKFLPTKRKWTVFSAPMSRCSLNELGHPVHIVKSAYDNVKMTTQEDLAFGEIILKRRQQEDN